MVAAISTSDVVSMFNVLEHIEHPDKMVEIFKSYMKKESLLVIEVPRHPSLATFANILGSDFSVYRHIAPPEHLQVFSENAIEILVKPDFDIVAKWGFGLGFQDILMTAIMISGLKNISMYQELHPLINDVQKEIDSKGFSDHMIFVMKKNK